MQALSVEGLQVRYPGLPVPALDLAGLRLEAGEMVALAGPSGSGKTTFINIVTGMERAEPAAWSGTKRISQRYPKVGAIAGGPEMSAS